MIWLSCPLSPTSRSCAVVSGTMTMSSWSWIPFEPFGVSRPSNLERRAAQLDRLAERIGAAEEIRRDGGADDGDARLLRLVRRGDERPLRDRRLPCLRVAP